MARPFNIASHFVDRQAEEGAVDHIALYHGDQRTSYAELAAMVNRIGNVLIELGVRQGDRVLLVLSDGPEFVAGWYAVQKIGAITAEAYTFLQPKDYTHFLRYTGADVVITDAVALEAIRAAGAPKHLLVAGAPPEDLRDGEYGLSELTARASDRLTAAETTADDIAIWKFTTGSTGAPKACVHPAGAALASYEAYARDVLAIGTEDVVLAVPKLFFGYARDLVALYPFAVGGAGIVFPERSTPELMFDLIERHRPTILVNVPTMMSAMVAHPRASDADLSSLRLCTSAGESLPPDLHQAWESAFGVEVVDGIGSSEAYHIYISNRPGAARPGTVGTPVPGYSARVTDDQGGEVPVGEVGVLEVRGPTIALEYHGDPDRTAATFRDGTLRTGDLFSADADGFFHHHGRADDLLKVGGIWVAPSEIEHCMVGHPDILECGVTGHSERGLVHPWAYVVPRPNATVRAEDLITYTRERLSGHKRPRQVRFVDALPRTSNGKLDRRALHALSEEEA